MDNRSADTIFNDKAFDCMDKNTKERLKKLSESIRGGTIQESLPEIMAFIKELPKDMYITREQKYAMYNVLFENIPERERERFNMLINALGI